ncbi:uncharacterized protein [Lepeophtheirus salmonis]|uniref:Enkurin domain-containing protein n=1 Tax=Lepeophtheirus salmonis TaxID=72036 RepID=A0A0K2UFD8_LEPSM|nr:uncharacterized protein LOC121123645 [Lepeophtheirus salmonis]XP_040574714.1 uncharacterized protein LOC121123645 [Lepeophtheirus salmonis]
MLNIPRGVTRKYVEELEDYQKQIRIFMRNHQILSYRLKKSTDTNERGNIRGQIETLERFLLQWNEKQKPVLEKIRREIKEVNRKSKDGIKRKKVGSCKATPSTSPYMSDTESNSDPCPTLTLAPGQFTGYITSYNRFTPDGYLDLKEKLKVDAENQEEFILPRIERVISNVQRNEFMNNLDLVLPVTLREMEERARFLNAKRIEYRNLTYIPELSEKKHRIDYNYWRGDYNSSPPTLRTRARVANGNNNQSSSKSTRLSRSSSSRAASPQSSTLIKNVVIKSSEESKKKVLSNNISYSELSPPSDQKHERKILSSNSLITRKNANVLALEKKLKELRETIAEFGPRTISTRKERTRRNELLAEELKLSKKVAKLQDKKI